jgi:ubiquitin-protein ligase
MRRQLVTKSESRALRRLKKEYEELLASPIENCAACPLLTSDGDIADLFEWHVNIMSTNGALRGTPFHFIMKFPKNYPDRAPKVTPATYIAHPNVFGDYICLDILTMSEETTTTAYRGWTNAYTVSSILVQLQSFLFEVCPTQKECEKMINRALNMKPCLCGHSGQHTVPEILAQNISSRKNVKELEVHMIDHSVEPWGNSVNFKSHWSDWKITRVVPGLQSDAHGIKFGWYVQKWNHIPLNAENHLEVKNALMNGRAGTITFGIEEDLTQKYTIGDRVRVTENFETHSRCHYETENFVSIGTKLKIIGKTRNGGLRVQRFPVPFTSAKIIQSEYYDRIVPFEDYVDQEPVQEMEDNFVDDNNDHAYVWSTLGLDFLEMLPDEVFYLFLEFCSWDAIARISSLSESIGANMLKSKRLQMESYRCFYTLKDATDPKCILGYGAQKKVMPKRSRVTRRKTDVLQQLHVSFDIMSYEAFHEAGVRNNIWKDRPVDAFIPLYINEEHGRRAMELNKELLPALVNHKVMNADTILLSIGKAMNTAVVDMMLSVEDVETGELQMIDSIKALEGYMALHHTLLAYALRYPQLIERCEETVGRFIKDVASRDKEITPDIGELLIALSLTSYQWDEFVLAWVEEMMIRNQRWTLAKYPSLLDVENSFSCVRLNRTYQATKTGKRLAMFQRFFIERIASPPELEGNPNKLKILFDRYNKNCGRPAYGLAEELQVHSRQVLNCNDWFNYFDLINFPAPNALRLWKWLINAMDISEGKRYHESSNILHWESSHLQSPGNNDHYCTRNCLCTGVVMNITKKKTRQITVNQVGMKDSEKLDVAFCVDNTGSMVPWVESAKKSVRLIMKKLRASGKKVRFGFVGYTDHTAKAPLTKVVDFTKKDHVCQEAVNQWNCVGNHDWAEALAPALVKVGGLSWDTSAQRICIIITDAPPHGLGNGGWDIYPEGDPDGSDVFVAAHTLGTAGVSLYPVHCVRHTADGLDESLYRGLAQRTGGAYLKMHSNAAGCLTDIVLASSMEEDTLDKLGVLMKPYYEQVKKSHPIAREEQIIYQIHAAMKADNITVNSKMPNEEFGPGLVKQIKDMAECMSIKQCHAITAQDYFSTFPGQPQTKITGYCGLITKNQVVRAYARMGQLMATADVEKNGCVFRRKKWQTAAFKDRKLEWLSEKSVTLQTKLRKFAPWKDLDHALRVKCIAIPNKRHYGRAPALSSSISKREPIKPAAKPVVEIKPVVEEIKCDWVRGTVIKAKRSFRVNSESIAVDEQFTVYFIAASKRYSIKRTNGRVITVKLEHTDKFSVVSQGPTSDVTVTAAAPEVKPAVSKNNLDLDLSDEPQVSQRNFMYDFSRGPVTIIPASYITLHPGVVTATLNPTSQVVYNLPANMTITVDIIFKHRAHMMSPHQGWFWLRSPTQELVRRTLTNSSVSVPTSVVQPPVPNVFEPARTTTDSILNLFNPIPSIPSSDTTSIPSFRPVFITDNSPTQPTIALQEPQPIVPEVATSTEVQPVVSSIVPEVRMMESPRRTNSVPSDSGSSEIEDLKFQPVSFDATIQPPLDFSRGPIAVGKQYYETLQRCAVRSQLNPASNKVGELKTGTVITIDAIYRQRAHMISPLQGWFWLSSPSKVLVQQVEVVPATETVQMEAQNVTKPAIVVEEQTTLTDITIPTVVVHDFDPCQANDLIHRLGIWGVPAHSPRVIDTRTFEFQVDTHQDGVIAINWAPMIRGKKIQMSWKAEYSQWRKNSTAV